MAANSGAEEADDARGGGGIAVHEAFDEARQDGRDHAEREHVQGDGEEDEGGGGRACGGGGGRVDRDSGRAGQLGLGDDRVGLLLRPSFELAHRLSVAEDGRKFPQISGKKGIRAGCTGCGARRIRGEAMMVTRIMSTPLQFAAPGAGVGDRFGFLHIDLNSFFASVEQQLHPEYRGKPLGVCGTMADTGALIAASYEAKALGIYTLTKVGEAKKICPDIILVNGSHSVYAEYSHKIAAAVERCCPVAHTPSIDEMVCELMGREREPPAARRIALEIKQAIKDDVGETLRCSIGMAPNRYLAKIASDMQKPDGLIGLLPSQLPRAIAHLASARSAGRGGTHGGAAERKGHHDYGAAACARPHGHARALGQRVGRPAVPLAARG